MSAIDWHHTTMDGLERMGDDGLPADPSFATWRPSELQEYAEHWRTIAMGLRCCGNCKSGHDDYNGFGCDIALAEQSGHCASIEDGGYVVDSHDSCHFKPSRWQAAT
jgi:hypothetical protein